MIKNKLIIFDFDGVIADTLTLSHRIMTIANPQVTLPHYRQLFEGNIFEAIDKKKDFQFVPDQDWDREYEKYIREQKLMSGIDLAIQQLADKYTLVIASSSKSSLIHIFLSTHNLHPYITEVFGYDIEKSKVKKFEMIFKKYGVNPTECVMITDTLGDIVEAEHVGIKSIAISGGFHDEATLLKGNPWALIKHPSQLISAVNRYFGQE